MIIDEYEDKNNVGYLSYWFRIIRNDINHAISKINKLKDEKQVTSNYQTRRSVNVDE